MVNVTAYGVFGCNKDQKTLSQSISTYMQGILINTNNVDTTGSCVGSKVSCGTPILFKARNAFPAGWPNYNYGAINVFKLDLVSTNFHACVSRFDFVYLFYAKGGNSKELKTLKLSSKQKTANFWRQKQPLCKTILNKKCISKVTCMYNNNSYHYH